MRRGSRREPEMIQYSTFLRALFWIFMGLLYALMIAGARIWAEELGLLMNVWKWLLATVWYVLLSIGVAAGTTLIGEREPRAGYYLLGITLIIMAILGFLLWHLL
jgi:hypothetical protein